MDTGADILKDENKNSIVYPSTNISHALKCCWHLFKRKKNIVLEVDHFTSKTVVGNCLVFIVPYLILLLYGAPLLVQTHNPSMKWRSINNWASTPSLYSYDRYEKRNIPVCKICTVGPQVYADVLNNRRQHKSCRIPLLVRLVSL
jgi:hypothetical protein